MPSAVHVSAPYVALSDAAQRVRLTLDSLALWVDKYKDLKIVLCDGSGYDFQEIIRRELPNADIECLHFFNDANLVSRHGKGYGEGEIIEYALKHSTFLANSEVFAKCTSKHFVSNLDEILVKWNEGFLCECYFVNYWSILGLRLEFIDTRFYISSKFFYLRYLRNAHRKVHDSDGYFLEHAFKDVIMDNKISRIISSVPIILSGTSGSSGVTGAIKRKKKAYLKQFLRRVVIRMNPIYHILLL